MLCVYCKGPHSYTSCALYTRALKSYAKVSVGSEFSGESPTPFIGHVNYPNVSIGLLLIYPVSVTVTITSSAGIRSSSENSPIGCL